jgi:hypothetical protein
MKALKTPDARPEIMQMLRRSGLQEFNSVYLSLARLLVRFRRSTTTQSSKIAFTTPPQQITLPEDPNFTAGSERSKKSSSSTESKAEPYAQNFATNFLDAICVTVAPWITNLPWVNPLPKLFLDLQYDSR